MFALIVGLAVGFVLDTVWSRIPTLQENGVRSKTLNEKYDLYGTIEHYHWGLGLMMLYLFLQSGFILGVSAALWASEWIHDPAHPFGLAKKHFKDSTILGIFLSLALIVLWVWRG